MLIGGARPDILRKKLSTGSFTAITATWKGIVSVRKMVFPSVVFVKSLLKTNRDHFCREVNA
jgi:hypothetical protein